MDNIRVINLIVQRRVIDKECLDCGNKLSYVGYCKNGKCGTAGRQTTYTEEEYYEAKQQLDEKQR